MIKFAFHNQGKPLKDLFPTVLTVVDMLMRQNDSALRQVSRVCLLFDICSRRLAKYLG
jgi:hypothetical protein